MNILGLFGPGPNPSATLLIDGKVEAFIEEERLSRIKTAPNSIPVLSAAACLKKAKITLDDIDAIAYGWDSIRYVNESQKFFTKMRNEAGDVSEYNLLQENLYSNLYHHERIKQTLQIGLGHLSKNRKLPEIHFLSHHLCHAASAYYCSGFEDANIITIDGSGEETTTMLAVGKNGTIETTKTFQLPHTIGGVYATFTEFLGFKAYQDEGKLMGLASYGKYDQSLQDKLDQVIPFNAETGEYTVNPKMRYVGDHTFGARFTDQFVKLFGNKREGAISALEAPYPDLAYAIQFRLEQILLALAKSQFKKTGIKNFCLAGGVAMNCVMNGKLAMQEYCENIFVQPAAADNGVSLGAALLLAKKLGKSAAFKMTHLYYGLEFSNADIEKAFKEAKVSYYKSADVHKETAKYLNEGKIIGWLQGAMEVGARALGNRSILASPLYPEMKDKLNLEVKHRENWRPFCPSMKEESYRKYIKAYADSPFMIMAFPIVDEIKDKVPSIVHIDGTARPQAVNKKDNHRFWTLLDEFEKLSGHGILINTSFNIQGEPIVCTPQDALRTFGGTGIDVLVMGDFISLKPSKI